VVDVGRGIRVEGFWQRYDTAREEAELLRVPPVAITAVVGDLVRVPPVVARCQADHWAGGCRVLALTSRPGAVPDPTWTALHRASDLVSALEGPDSEFPLPVIDLPGDLPAWLRPLLDRLRVGGVGLVRYVLAGDPSDEDLATWHGEIGRPAVLDLVSPLPPARVLELVERGEPVASAADVAMTAQLLMALRSEVDR
jgi:hypothetical protein